MSRNSLLKTGEIFPPSMGTRKNPVIKIDNLTPPTTIVSADKESKERNAKIVWIEYYQRLNFSSDVTTTQATSEYIKCKH